MRNIIICYKWVVDEADIKANSDFSVDFSKAKGKISEYDKNAIEAAMNAARALQGKVIGLTFGTAKAKQSLKDALSRGPEQGCIINAPEETKIDGAVTAKALAAAIKRFNDVGLVICAEGASDSYARQTAPRIGTLLDWPVISSVCKMEFHDNSVIATRKLDNCMEKVIVELPAVVAVLPEIYQAPIPGLKAVMVAGKKPITEFTIEELGVDIFPQTEITGIKGYEMNRKNIIYNEGDAANKVSQLLTSLRKEGVL